MLKAKKENKVYLINESQKDAYLNQGFSIYTAEGKLVARSQTDTVSVAKYESLQKENDNLKKEIEALKEQTSKKSNKGKGKENDAQAPEGDKQPEGMAEE